MTEYEYDKLLKRAREQLPEKSNKTERLEMPRLVSFVMGNRTQVKNFVDASKVIRREPDHLLKYLAKELASQGNLEGRAAMFQGKFSGMQINKKFEKYVEEFVLCPECKKPDTKLIKRDRLTFIRCEACGAEKSVRTVR